MRTKLTTIGYWGATGPVATAFVLGGAIDAAHPPSAVAFLAHLGYPLYFGVLIGVWKVLGGLAIVAPRFPRLKEWAYAGIFFDLTGAAVSHAATGDAAKNVIVPLVLAGLALTSWSLRPQSRKLAAGPRVGADRHARLVPANAT
ncbi:MAG TPA: DoxX family protein [Polyangiaceae bacterium]|nr:DoxX family protein [Polyangiaceae bacterium]